MQRANPDLKRARQLARQLLRDGTAISARQAEQIAQISLDPSLSGAAKDGLIYLAHSKGAEFEIADLTAEDIEAAAKQGVEIAQHIALSLLDPEEMARA